MYDLGSLGSLNGISDAMDINEKSQAVGTGPVGMLSHAFMWEVTFNHPPAALFTLSTAGEGGAVTFDASASSDPDGDALIYAWDFGDGGATGSGITASRIYADNGTYQVTLTVSDAAGATATATHSVTVANVVPTVEAISAPVDPVAVGTSVAVSANFTDPGILDTHTGNFDWNDGSTSPATITEANGSGTASASHVYAAPGVYTLTLTVTDKDGGAGQSVYQFVVVFDPAAGFATGAGWIPSSEGACRLAGCTDATVGKAMFGFVSRYQKGATTPSGTTEFQFRDGGLRFTSESYQWFVVSGPQAQLKGTGTVNGVAGYGFLLTARDGDQQGGGGVDRFRIRIWDASGTVVYDNQIGTPDNSEPTTALGGGQIQIHQ